MRDFLDWLAGHCAADMIERQPDARTRVANLKIDGDRLWQSLMAMAKIGATEKGGNCRLALSDLDKAGRALFIGWAEAAGCTIGVDRMGNIFARRPGRNDALPPVLTGSQLGTPPTARRVVRVH